MRHANLKKGTYSLRIVWASAFSHKNTNVDIPVLNEVRSQAGYNVKGVFKVGRIIMLSLLIILFNTQPAIENEPLRTKDRNYIY